MFKKLFFIFIIINLSFNLDAQDLKLYPFKSGMIKYKFEGRTTGTEIIYFDDFGKLLSIKKTTFLISNKNIIKETVLSIYRNDTLFEINMQDNTVSGYKIDNQTIKNKLISADMLQALGYDKLGIENIAGMNCNKYSGKNGKLWVWNNIVLKSEMEILDTNITKEAIEIITRIDVPKYMFEIPKNCKIIIQ